MQDVKHIDFATYKELYAQLEQKYRTYQKLIEEKCATQLDPHIRVYEEKVAALHSNFELVEAHLSREEKAALLKEIDTEAHAACLLLFDLCTPIVQEKEARLRKLNARMRFAQETIRDLYLQD
jgi:hypothetical protein